MTLEELLEYTAEDLLDDRADILEGDPDSLWSDRLIVRHLNRAQDILANDAWVICDYAHPQAGRIVLATGKPIYDLHKSVLRVREVFTDLSDLPLNNFADSSLLGYAPCNGAIWPDIYTNTTASAGATLGYSTETGTRLMRVYRTPSATENGHILSMRVARMPVTYLTLDDIQCKPEVPEEFHLLMCDYAAGRCLTQPTVDSSDKVTGRELLASFADAVKKAKQARGRAEMNKAPWIFNSATAGR